MSLPSDRKALKAHWRPFFDTLWKAYPLHQDFTGAYSAFLDLIIEGDVDPQYLLAKAESFARNTDPSRLEYVPHLKSWIKNRRFDDEDLFTDQTVAKREWFKGVWQRGDAQSVAVKYGFIYNHPPIPSDVEDMAAWHLDQRKLWISKVANHILHGKEPPE